MSDKSTPIIHQAYVYKSGRKLDTDPEFSGSFAEVRNWLIDHVLEPDSSTLRVHTGSKDDRDYMIAWSVKKFLEMTNPGAAYFNQQTGQINIPNVALATKPTKIVEDLFMPDEKVNHPSHYNKGKIEVIEAIEDWGLGFSLGNAVKYIARAEHKGNPIEDLEKAAWYIRREITRRQNDKSEAKRVFVSKPSKRKIGKFDNQGWVITDSPGLDDETSNYLTRMVDWAREQKEKYGNEYGITIVLGSNGVNMWGSSDVKYGEIWEKIQ